MENKQVEFFLSIVIHPTWSSHHFWLPLKLLPLVSHTFLILNPHCCRVRFLRQKTGPLLPCLKPFSAAPFPMTTFFAVVGLRSVPCENMMGIMDHILQNSAHKFCIQLQEHYLMLLKFQTYVIKLSL